MAVEITPEHSPIGASSMDRWSVCPGSVRLSKTVQQKDSDFSKEGTTAHAKATAWLVLDMQPKFPDTVDGMEMHAAVREYVYICKRYITDVAIDMGAEWGCEHSFDLSSVYPGCYGTADFWCYWPWLKKLIVLDFKYGAGVFVPVENNLQLLYYALGVMVTKKFDIKDIEVGIVQPRCMAKDDSGFRTWSVDPLDMYEFRQELIAAAKRTESPNAPLVTGEHCRWCPANTAQICPEQKALVVRQLQNPFMPSRSYNPEELRRALDQRTALKAYIKALDEFAYHELQSGAKIPGYKMVEKWPQRSWTDLTAAANMLRAAGYSDKDILEPAVLKSPAQIEKLLGKDNQGLVEKFIQKISNGHTVVEDDDNRPSITSGPEAVFTKIINPLE
jgi:hypothetical protein